MSSTGIRWADSSDESEDEYPTSMNNITQHSGLNDGSIPNVQEGHAPAGRGVAGFSSDEEEEQVEEESESSSSEEDEPVQTETKILPPKVEIKKKPPPKRPLSKKEKQALKAKELDALDDIFGEFGIDVVPDKPEPKKAPETKEKAQSPVEDAKNETEGRAASKRRKKKKKNKGGDGGGENKTSNTKEDKPAEPTELLDVAAVLKAKTKTKGKTSAEIAAASAAKEAKAKKLAAEKKKKKKKRDKYLNGAPSR